MKATLVAIAVALGVAGLTMLAVGQSRATVFAAWQVVGVPKGDVLNVRQFPSASSQKQAAYPNGTVLQMTGRCTGGVHLLDLTGRPASTQTALVRREWCQVWHDPKRNGVYVAGWVYGRFIAPR